MYHVKVKKQGEKITRFLGSGGKVNRLRIHAVQFDSKERAQAVANEITTNNPEYSATVADVFKPKRTAAVVAAFVILAGTIHAAERKYYCKASHLGAGAVAVSCLNGGDPTVAGRVADSLIVSCGTK